MQESWGGADWKCDACDLHGPVDKMLLCERCRAKLERDLLRQRSWAYSAIVFGLSDEEREAVRRQVIAKHGHALELIAAEKPRRRR